MCFSVTKTTTSTVGTWTPAGDPATTDDVVIAHDWSSGWAAAGGLANAYASTITIEDGGHLHITNALANFAGTMTIESGGNYEIDGDMTNWTGSIDVQAGAVFTSHYDFDAGDDADGASLTVNGTLVMTGADPQGVLTLDLVVGGTGRIYARAITLNGNGSTSSTTLPVELISFKSKNSSSGNELFWSTGSEINNSHFDIEKSFDGENFFTIGQVQGNGNSSEINNYSFFDNTQLGENAYYKLKQVDYDGAINYSHIINTNSTKKSISIVQKENSSEFYVLSPNKEEIVIQAFDISGRLVYNKSYSANESSRFNFNINNQGSHIIIVKSKFNSTSKKAIIR